MVFEQFNEHFSHFQFKAVFLKKVQIWSFFWSVFSPTAGKYGPEKTPYLETFHAVADFLSYCSSQYPEFENIYTLTTLNKTYKNHEKNNASQTCQDESGLLKVLNTEDKKNEKFNSTENLHNCEKEGNVLKGNNIASQIGVRLEGKFVSKNVINLSRRNLSASEISLLSKGLKFVPTANKIDRAKLKTELEEYGRKLRLMWHFRNDERSFAADRFRPLTILQRKNRRLCIV